MNMGSFSPGRVMLNELGFELGDAPVGESVVGAGGFGPFFQGPVVAGELAEALFERGVLSGDPLGGVWRPVLFQVADLAFLCPRCRAGPCESTFRTS